MGQGIGADALTVPPPLPVAHLAAFDVYPRNEDHFDGLRRLKAFRMREVVALRTPEQVVDHLDQSAHFLDALAGEVGLPLERRAASDPFFDQSGDRAAFQQLLPVKHECVYKGRGGARRRARTTPPSRLSRPAGARGGPSHSSVRQCG
ncbi:hypothetical protein [Streptomyces sp. NPDC059816]|uniref:hypothetical protein n=1 Tax=Streptomyces sp. NPDC059816 TaxID=3346960 RepID=UPI0036472711